MLIGRENVIGRRKGDPVLGKDWTKIRGAK